VRRAGWAAVLGALALACGVASCGVLDRDNPADPGGGDGNTGVELVAAFPGGASGVTPSRVSVIRYAVSDTVGGHDIAETITGTMNLVAGQAKALVPGVPAGPGRVFRVDVYDQNQIRTFAAADTVDLAAGQAKPLAHGLSTSVQLTLRRLTGAVELTSQLPPEITTVTVSITVDGDTLRTTYAVDDDGLVERIDEVPTGTDVEILLEGSDQTEQILIQRALLTDVRQELVARVALAVETGAVSVLALFPEYLPQAAVDRFSDAAGTFYRRSEDASLPQADEAVDFDERFLHTALGPNGEAVRFYNLDVQATAPAAVYVLVDRRGDAIAGQLPIFDALPGDDAYSDLKQVWEVAVPERDYRVNSLTSYQAIQEQALEAVATETVLNCVMAPSGSQASLRYGQADATALQAGWYRDQIVRYFLFENPESTAQVAFESGEISAPLMYAFLENDQNVTDGFALDEDGDTHNVVTRLPGQEGYAPLWAVRVFLLDVFDRVSDVATAQDQERAEESILEFEEILYVNAPIVSGD